MAIVQRPNKIEAQEMEEETTNKEQSEIASNKNSKENQATEIAGNKMEMAEDVLEALWINASVGIIINHDSNSSLKSTIPISIVIIIIFLDKACVPVPGIKAYGICVSECGKRCPE